MKLILILFVLLALPWKVEAQITDTLATIETDETRRADSIKEAHAAALWAFLDSLYRASREKKEDKPRPRWRVLRGEAIGKIYYAPPLPEDTTIYIRERIPLDSVAMLYNCGCREKPYINSFLLLDTLTLNTYLDTAQCPSTFQAWFEEGKFALWTQIYTCDTLGYRITKWQETVIKSKPSKGDLE